MEPRNLKLLAEIMLVVGCILTALGVALTYVMDDNLIGALLMIFGCGMALISLPTFMILMMLTSVNIVPDNKK